MALPLPTETCRQYIKAAAESIGMTFFFGTEADAFLERLRSTSDLVEDGFCLMVDSSDKIKRDVDGWCQIPVRLNLGMQDRYGSVMTQAEEQGTGTPRTDIRTDMYNAWVDIIAYVEANYFSCEIQREWDWQPYNFGDNVCSGIIVDFNFIINDYDCE